MSTKRNASAKPAAKVETAKRAPSKKSAARDVQKDDTVSLEPIVEAMRKQLPKSRHAEGEAFINAFYKRMIAKIEIRDVSSAFAMEQIKYTTELPLDYMVLEQAKSMED